MKRKGAQSKLRGRNITRKSFLPVNQKIGPPSSSYHARPGRSASREGRDWTGRALQQRKRKFFVDIPSHIFGSALQDRWRPREEPSSTTLQAPFRTF
jgi:hypothetical protein